MRHTTARHRAGHTTLVHNIPKEACGKSRLICGRTACEKKRKAVLPRLRAGGFLRVPFGVPSRFGFDVAFGLPRWLGWGLSFLLFFLVGGGSESLVQGGWRWRCGDTGGAGWRVVGYMRAAPAAGGCATVVPAAFRCGSGGMGERCEQRTQTAKRKKKKKKGQRCVRVRAGRGCSTSVNRGREMLASEEAAPHKGKVSGCLLAS